MSGLGETPEEEAGDEGEDEDRNGWNSKCAVAAVVKEEDVGEGRDAAEMEGGGGEGVSVTLISGEAGGEAMGDMAEEAEAGGLAGSTTSTGQRLSRLIIVVHGIEQLAIYSSKE